MYNKNNSEIHISLSGGDAFENPAGDDHILGYLHRNYASPLRLHTLAQTFSMSDAAFSRYVKKHTGTTFEAYIRQIRLNHACEDLILTPKAITAVALDNGFSCASAFNKTFRDTYGQTPGEYRKKHFSPEDRTPLKYTLDIDCDVRVSQPYKQPFFETINMGIAQDFRHRSFQQQFARIARDGHFRYARIHNLFAPEMEYRSGHNYHQLNFERIDEVLELILENGLLPMIELGQKPRIVKKNIYETLFLDATEPLFLSEAEQTAVMGRFFAHVRTRYGEKSVSQWRFEYWFDYTKAENPDRDILQFLDQYDRLAQLLYTHLPDAVMGGCGLPLIDYDMETIIRTWAHKKYPPVFLTFGYFPYNGRDLSKPLQWMTAWITDTSHINAECARMKTLTQKYMGKELPIYITEWNLSLSNRNSFNDSCEKAALLVQYMQTLSPAVDMIAYYTASDFSARTFDNTLTLSGASGLLSKNGIPKPAYYAMKFMALELPRTLLREKGLSITGDGTHYHILACHPGTFVWDFSCRSEDEITPQSLDQLFVSMGSKTCHISLNVINDGTYLATWHSLSPTHSSLLAYWEKIRPLEPLDTVFTDYLGQISQPRISTQYLTAHEGRLQLHLELEPHEILWIRLAPVPPQ